MKLTSKQRKKIKDQRQGVYASQKLQKKESGHV